MYPGLAVVLPLLPRRSAHLVAWATRFLQAISIHLPDNMAIRAVTTHDGASPAAVGLRDRHLIRVPGLNWRICNARQTKRHHRCKW